jgi:hypothetical protein
MATGPVVHATAATTATDATTGQACTLRSQVLLVANSEAPRAGQANKGSWTDVDTQLVRPWYGLYDSWSDPTMLHQLPRPENFGATPSTPDTPVQMGDHFQWVLNGYCAEDGAPFTSQGHAIGYCGRSVGQGLATVRGHTAYLRWENVGTLFVLVDPGARGVLNSMLTSSDSTNNSCDSGTATMFQVNGAFVDTTT